jgi:hypothetical protein
LIKGLRFQSQIFLQEHHYHTHKKFIDRRPKSCLVLDSKMVRIRRVDPGSGGKLFQCSYGV